MQEQHQVGSNGSKGPEKGSKNSAKGIGGFGKGGKGGKGKGVFPGKCFKFGEVGYRKQDCSKVAVFRMHRRITSSLCGISVTWTWMAVGR